MSASVLLLAVSIGFSQPFDGKRTVVIEREDGTRVRNLVSGVPAKAGEDVEWDGLDDAGKVAAPGRYRWRALAHPGLSAERVFSFCDGPGSNHGTLMASATDGKLLFFATPCSEGGHDIEALNPDGTRYGGWCAPYGHGLSGIRLAVQDGFLYAEYSGSLGGKNAGVQVLKIDIAAKKVVAFDKTGAIGKGVRFNDNTFTDAKSGLTYVADTEGNVVRVYDRGRRLVRTLGATPGGAVLGPYVAERLHGPSSVVVGPDGLVWVTERNRWMPKRLAAFDATSGKVVKSLFGPTRYGAPGAGIDPRDPTRWVGMQSLFKVDVRAKTAEPTHVIGGLRARRYVFHREAGRTFLISWCDNGVTAVQELLATGVLKPMALIASAHGFAYFHRWKPPAAFRAAFDGYSKGDTRHFGTPEKPQQGPGVLWRDLNGNGEMDDPSEFSFSDQSVWSHVAGTGWGSGFDDLVFRFPAIRRDGGNYLVTIRPNGFLPNGVPNYPTLGEGLAGAVRVKDPPARLQAESAVDRQGNVIFNSSPYMASVAPDGKVNWSFPNRWKGVHGSHDSPMPKCGELQGALFFLGHGALDSTHDVFALVGNHGKMYFIDSTGLYVDELFRDVRTFSGNGPYTIGGEAFGGTFEKGDDGVWYLQAGGLAYNVYQVKGFEGIVRKEGSVALTAEDVKRIESTAAAKPSDPGVLREARIGRYGKGFAGLKPIRWESDRLHPVEIALGTASGRLHFRFSVRDESPWVNNGTDVQSLFKTGDACQIELETADGLVRLLVAPMGGETKAVRYRDGLRRGKQADSVLFQSPWRTELIDSVTVLDSVEAKVGRNGPKYVLEGSVPLADLGLGPTPPRVVKGDVGVIYGNAEGTVNEYRNHWANKSTGLVNDVPGEVMFTPKLWGTFRFDEAAPATKLVRTGLLGCNPPPAALKAKFPDADLKRRINGWSPQWKADGYGWGWGYHGTIYRFSGTNTSGSVVLGGASGHFIGHLAENPDCVNLKGFVGGTKPGEYFCRGENGLISRLKWHPELERLVVEERLGDMSGLEALCLDAQGRVSIGKAGWEWNDAPGAPLRNGIPSGPLGTFSTLDGETVLAFMPAHSQCALMRTTLATDERTSRSSKERLKAWMRKGRPRAPLPPGSAPYRVGREERVIAVGARGEAAVFKVKGPAFDGESSEVALDWETPPRSVTSVAIDDPLAPKRLYAAADGAVVVFALKPDGGWARERTLPFGGEVHVASDGERLWVSVRDENCVKAYRLDSLAKPELTYAGTKAEPLRSPGRIAACNGRVVVHDRGSQSLVKLEMR